MINAAARRAPQRPGSLTAAALLVTVVWLVARLVFFEGIWGADDYFYMKFATLWNPPPLTHLEARLLFNWAIRQSHTVFGGSEASWIIPALCSSAVLLGSAMFLGFRYAGIRGLVASGLLVATLPLDVIWSTTPNASPFSVGGTAAATVFLVSFGGLSTLIAASAFAAAAILAHSTAAFYILSLGVSHFLFIRNLRSVYFVGIALPLFVLFDLATNLAITGDSWHGFRVLQQWHDPEVKMPLYSRAWFAYPVTHFLISKDLVFLPVLCLAAIVFTPTLRNRPEVRILAATAAFTWLWFGYGTARPTNYEPFWREVRFNYPSALALAVIMGIFVSHLSRGRAVVLLAIICALNILIVAMSGPWGQRDDISRQFLPIVKAHPEALFLTDTYTQRDLEMWNAYVPLDNVITYDSIAAGVVKATTKQSVFLIDNPLADRSELFNRPKRSTKMPKLALGEVVFRSQPCMRAIAYVLPSRITTASPFFVRRPSGTLRRVIHIAQ